MLCLSVTLTVAMLLILVVLVATAAAGAGMSRVSLKADGTQTSGSSGGPSISGGGVLVAFSSSGQLTSDDLNGSQSDVYVRWRSGSTILISKDWQGGSPSAPCMAPVISADGSAVIFYSAANDLVQGMSGNGTLQVYVRRDGVNYLVSHSTTSLTTPCAAGASPLDISADGAYILFSSNSTDLVSGDTNGVGDVFLYDANSGAISRVSVASDGTQANGTSGGGVLSADGNYVAYSSGASNLVSGDTNSRADVFVSAAAGGSTVRVSVGSSGAQANNTSDSPDLSADGSVVVYRSDATNLVSSDTNGGSDIFLCTRDGSGCVRVSLNSAGQQTTNGYSSMNPRVSGDGQTVLFESGALNLVSGDTNYKYDVFTRLLATGETRRVSVAGDGTQANDHCQQSVLSLDGRFVAFATMASTLVSGDTNGASDIFATDAAGRGDPWLWDSPGAPSGLDPVTFSTGNATTSATDLSLPGIGPSLVFARYYNSQDGGTNGPLGYGWNHTYSMRLLFPSASVVTLIFPDGMRGHFTATTGGDYASPQGVTERLHKNGNNTYTLTSLDRGTCSFTSTGRLSGLSDRYGNSTVLTYDGNGLLAEVEDAGGRGFTLTYTSGRITELEDSAGRSATYEYDQSGNLTGVTDPNGHETTYGFDSYHQLLWVRQPEPSTNPLFTNAYVLDRVVSQTNALGEEASVELDAVSGSSVVEDNRGHSSTCTWDPLFRLTRHTDPYGNHYDITYTPAGFVETFTDENGHESSFEYDSLGNVISATDPLGHETEASYDT